MERAERYFREALSRRADYGEAANNLALVLVSRGQADAAVSLLDDISEADSRLRVGVRHARQDPLQRRPAERKPSRCSSGSCSGIRRMRVALELLSQWKK